MKKWKQFSVICGRFSARWITIGRLMTALFHENDGIHSFINISNEASSIGNFSLFSNRLVHEARLTNDLHWECLQLADVIWIHLLLISFLVWLRIKNPKTYNRRFLARHEKTLLIDYLLFSRIRLLSLSSQLLLIFHLKSLFFPMIFRSPMLVKNIFPMTDYFAVGPEIPTAQLDGIDREKHFSQGDTKLSVICAIHVRSV